MENKASGRSFLPIALLFVLSSLLIFAARDWLADKNMDYRVLLTGNAILFLATGISFYLYTKALTNKNVQVFLRMVYGSLIIKMVFCVAATLLYLYLSGPGVSKQAVLGCFGLYLLYTIAEVRVLMRLTKKLPKNA
jgi:hypothetical protein